MRLRSSLLALAVTTLTVGAVAASGPALAATSGTHAAKAHVVVRFALDAGQDGAVWYLKPGSAIRHPVQGGNVSGGIRISPLAAGTYVLQIQESDEEDDGDYASRTFTVRRGETLDLGTLKPTHQPLTLSGAGPIGGQVTDDFTDWNASGRSAKVSRTGHYSLDGLIPGTYTITAQKKGYADRNYTVIVREPVKDVTVGKRLQ